jgi:hypothetical protein
LGKTTNKLRVIEKLLFDAYRQLITIGVERYNRRITVGEVPFVHCRRNTIAKLHWRIDQY